MSAPLIQISFSLLDQLQQEVHYLKIHTLPNYHKRIMVKALKAKYSTITIQKICEVVQIKASTYYYKPKRPYLPMYVHERKVDPKQYEALKEQLQCYDVNLMDNASKRHLVKILVPKYNRLTIRKICQMVKINVSTYYYKPVPVMQSIQKIRLKVKVELYQAQKQGLKNFGNEINDHVFDGSVIRAEDNFAVYRLGNVRIQDQPDDSSYLKIGEWTALTA